MSRNKKSRKIGRLNPVKSDKKPITVEKEQRLRKQTGNKAGSRQQVVDNKSNASELDANRDPRLGSKKPIDLGTSIKPVNAPSIKKAIKDRGPSVAPIKVIDNTPSLEEELIAIENNADLQLLSSRSESGETLTDQELEFLETNLNRYQDLIAQLGLQVEEADLPEVNDEDELWSKLDDTDFSEFTD